MRSERLARLRAGIQAGLIASVVLGFVIWLFGYITGYRLALALLYITAACFGLIAGAQAFISNSDQLVERDEVLAELERKSQDKALRAAAGVRRGRRG